MYVSWDVWLEVDIYTTDVKFVLGEIEFRLAKFEYRFLFWVS